MIAKKLTDLIGNTPLLEFSNFNARAESESNRKAGIFQPGR